jgi:hypothetical protein
MVALPPAMETQSHTKTARADGTAVDRDKTGVSESALPQ